MTTTLGDAPGSSRLSHATDSFSRLIRLPCSRCGAWLMLHAYPTHTDGESESLHNTFDVRNPHIRTFIEDCTGRAGSNILRPLLPDNNSSASSWTKSTYTQVPT